MHLLLIDAMNLIRRVYAAVEDSEFAAEATRNKVIDIIGANVRGRKATHLLMVYEDQEPTWRHRIWPEYKAGRSPMPEALANDLSEMRADLERSGIHSYRMSGWEADDVVATVADRAARSGLQVTILSTDKGFCQLVSERISVLNHFDRFLWNEEAVHQRWGLAPAQLTDYWALCGDQTNHLPGVPGIGKKGAAQVLDLCGSLDHAIGWPEILPERLSNALGQGIPSAIRTRVLATLRTDLELGISLSSLRAKS